MSRRESGIKRIFPGKGERKRGQRSEKVLLLALCALLLLPGELTGLCARAAVPEERPQTETPAPREESAAGEPDTEVVLDARLEAERPEDDEPPTEVVADDYPYGLNGKKIFNPSPQRAVWMAALCPGLGQIYNRRYWKLPIVVGGFMGLGYAASWNNSQYADYTQGYRDLVDSDPSTKSYMDFFPPTVNESDFDKSWLQQVFKSRRDYYRRNRDLCIIGLVALYLVCIVDAYVDASMAHFDISPDLALDMTPALLQPSPGGGPVLGMNWAFTF